MRRWGNKNILADNIAVLIAFIIVDNPDFADQVAMVNKKWTSVGGSRTSYCETFPDGITIECHGKTKLRNTNRASAEAAHTHTQRDHPTLDEEEEAESLGE